MSAMMEYGPLTAFLVVMAIGGLVASNQKISQLQEMSQMRRRLLGLFIIEMSGLAASAWTWMIHNQMVTGGSELVDVGLLCGALIPPGTVTRRTRDWYALTPVTLCNPL